MKNNDLIYGPLPKHEKTLSDLQLAQAALEAALNVVRVRDRRIAELEAALKELQTEFFAHQEDPQRSVTYKWSLTRIGYALAGSPSALDALLAQARREALESAIKVCMESAERNRRASHRIPRYAGDESQSIFRELAQEDEVIAGELRLIIGRLTP